MKRCPKCNRTFPDESQKFCTVDGGLLIAAQPAFDPNATIRATSAELDAMAEQSQAPDRATSRELPDPNATLAAAGAPTAVLPRNTGQTVMPPGAQPPPPPVNPSPPPVAAAPAGAPAPATGATAPKKKSKLPLILGLLAVLLILGVGGIVGLFFFVIKPQLDANNPSVVTTDPAPTNDNQAVSETSPVSENSPAAAPYTPPPNTIKVTNSRAALDGKLAEHYFDFSFYYPDSWRRDPDAGVPGAVNYASVERRLPPDFTQENFSVGWYTSEGTFEADKDLFPKLVEQFSATLAKNYPEYQKVYEGPTKINSMDAYEFRWTGFSKGTEKGDIQLWGRVVFLPVGAEGNTSGATLTMLATSLAPELNHVDDVGVKGQLPVILESFRFGNSQ